MGGVQAAIRRGCFLAILGALALTFASPGVSAEITARGGVLHALGGKWLALPVQWAEIEQQWVISATIMNQSSDGRGITADEMLATFCEQMLDRKIGAPDKSIKATDVFRVDLDILGPNRQPIWPAPAPVPVKNGNCHLAEGEKILTPTYPGRLAGWEFVTLNFQANGDTQRPTYVFQPQDGSNVDLGDFDFAAACAAMLADPSIRNIRAKIEKQNPAIRMDTGSMMVIAKQAAKQGVFVGDIFDIANGTCVEQNP